MLQSCMLIWLCSVHQCPTNEWRLLSDAVLQSVCAAARHMSISVLCIFQCVCYWWLCYSHVHASVLYYAVSGWLQSVCAAIRHAPLPVLRDVVWSRSCDAAASGRCPREHAQRQCRTCSTATWTQEGPCLSACLCLSVCLWPSLSIWLICDVCIVRLLTGILLVCDEPCTSFFLHFFLTYLLPCLLIFLWE